MSAFLQSGRAQSLRWRRQASYQPGELFGLRSLLSTGDLPQHGCDDSTADSTSDELKQRVYACRRAYFDLWRQV